MNIRGTNSTAVNTVVDLFATPASASSRDDDRGFERALQTPAPRNEQPAPRTNADDRSVKPRDNGSSEHDRRETPAASQSKREASEKPVTQDCEPTTEPAPTSATQEDLTDEAVVASQDEQETVAEKEDLTADSMAIAVCIAGEVKVPEATQPKVDLKVVTPEVVEAEPAEPDVIPVTTKTAAVTLKIVIDEPQPPNSLPTGLTDEKTIPENLNAIETAFAAVAPAATEEPAAVAPEGEPVAGIGVLPSALPAGNSKGSVQTTKPARSTGKSTEPGEAPSATTKHSLEALPSEVTETAVASTEPVEANTDKRKRDVHEDSESAKTPAATTEPSSIPEVIESAAPTVEALPEAKLTTATNSPATDRIPGTTPPTAEAAAVNGAPTPNPAAAIIQRLPAHALVRSANATANQESAPLHIDAARFLQRVTRAFESAQERGGEIRLRLSPPELGALRVDVQMQEHGLVARLEVETPEARTVLIENLPALRERLAEQGLKLESFEVNLSQRESPQQRNDFTDQSPERNPHPEPRTTRTVTPRPQNSPVSAAPVAPPTGLQDRRLNVVV